MAYYKAKTKDGSCPFCKIVTRELETPGIFWENDEFMAFLSIDPNTEGFSVVIPKEHYHSDVLEMPNDMLQKFIFSAKKVSKILKNFYQDVGRVGLLMEGTGIDHAHIKLFPMHGTEELKKGEWKQYLSGKKFWFEKYEGWICSGGGPKADKNKLRELANKLRDSQK